MRELRLAVRVDHYEQAVAFYRDVLEKTAHELVAGGAELIAARVVPPWSHRNVRLRAPDGMQLTLFAVLGDS